jgi:putative NADH-flavin reductase
MTAFVRSPAKITPRDPRLRVVEGNPRDAAAMARALPSHDVVLSALGPTAREAMRPISLVSDCATSTVAAMAAAHVDRLVDGRWRGHRC